jgi:hypothetical protein
MQFAKAVQQHHHLHQALSNPDATKLQVCLMHFAHALQPRSYLTAIALTEYSGKSAPTQALLFSFLFLSTNGLI